MALDNRLKLIASFVRPGCRIADIGTDHAHLPIFLVKNGVCPFAIASDIGEKPVAIARKNIAEARLEGQISVRAGDGLSVISPGEVDDLIIAGMGGETIAGIIGAAGWLKNEKYRLILQPMTRSENLREYLFSEGFAIIDEQIAETGDKLYPVICAEYNPAAASEQAKRPAAVIRGGLNLSRDRKYLEKQRDRLLKAGNSLKNAGKFEEAEKFFKLADEIFK
ncbi:MAG TPA: SAM-dependent methyltransferase [Clostridiales bacterium]|nr:SAM-dependent methyltransferase [Clostridiales bacterium]